MIFYDVPREGLEPPRACTHQILSQARLPIPPPRHYALKVVAKLFYNLAMCQVIGLTDMKIFKIYFFIIYNIIVINLFVLILSN